jgi:hypothetical protein
MDVQMGFALVFLRSDWHFCVEDFVDSLEPRIIGGLVHAKNVEEGVFGHLLMLKLILELMDNFLINLSSNTH